MHKEFRNKHNRRKLSPAMRHQRSELQARHRPYKKAKEFTFIQPVTRKSLHPEAIVEKQEPAVKQSKRQQRRDRKSFQEEDRIRRLALEPDTSIGEMIFNPALTMEKVSTTDDITLSRGSILSLHIIKWLAVGICLANNTSHFVNRRGFSIASISFSDAAGIMTKVALFGFVMDYVCMLITCIIGHFSDQKFSIRKFKAVKSRYYLSQSIWYLIAALAGTWSNALGALIYTATVVLSIMLRFHTYQLTSRFSTGRQLLIIAINVMLCAGIGMIYGHYAFHDLEKIVLYILNI